MELRSLPVVNDYIRLNNKLTDFVLAKLDKSLDINAYLNRQGEFEDIYKIKIVHIQQYTVLHTAIECNNVNGVNWVLENRADINKKMQIIHGRYVHDVLPSDCKIIPFYGFAISPLQLALKNNFLSIARILVDKGADISCLKDDEKKKLEISMVSMPNSFINYSSYFSNNDNNYNKPFNPPCP